MKTEKIILNEERNVILTAYIQPVEGEFPNILKRPAIMVIPGGGYTMCSERETEPVAYPYLHAGYHVFILRYSVGKDAKWPNPLNDYEAAMELIRSKADSWHLYPDKVAVVGFSAGGHLAGCAVTMAKNKANAGILGYAALEGETIQGYHPTAPDVISAVDAGTAPCFLFSSRTDNMVPIRNTIKMLEALTEYGISFESHIYNYGPHGFSTGASSVMVQGLPASNRIPEWVEDSILWLKDMFGDFSETGLTEPACRPVVNDDRKVYFSVDCTVNYLMKHPEAAKLIAPLMQGSNEAYQDFLNEPEEDEPRMNSEALMDYMTLRDILGFGQTDQKTIEQIDWKLREIPAAEQNGII